MGQTKLALRQIKEDGASTGGSIFFDGTTWVPQTIFTTDNILSTAVNAGLDSSIALLSKAVVASGQTSAVKALTTTVTGNGYSAFNSVISSTSGAVDVLAFDASITSSSATGKHLMRLSGGNSHAGLILTNTSVTTDSYISIVTGGSTWIFGNDSSDSGALKMSNSAVLGNTDRFRLTTGGQLRLPSYTTTSSFTGTQVGLLGFDSSGNIITLAPGGSGTVTSVAALTLGTSGTDLSSSVANGTTTPVITLNVPTASASNRGALSSTDWTTFNNKQGAITLTTTGTSGAATLIGNTLNIPNYATGSGDMVLASIQTVTGAKTFNDGKLILRNVANTFNGVFTNTNTADRTYTLQNNSGTLAFLSDITGTNSGVNTGDQTITLTGEATGSGTGSFAVTLTNSAVIGKVLTGYTSGAGTVAATDTILQAIQKLDGNNAGKVTSVSIASSNGFSGSSSGGTTPILTVGTTITGLLKGNGTAISAATVGTDYSVGTSALATGILKSTTSTGALSIAVAGDFPTLNQNTTGTAANVTGVVAIVNGGTGQTTANAAFNALAPSQTSNANKVLQTNGTNTSWVDNFKFTTILPTNALDANTGTNVVADSSTSTLTLNSQNEYLIVSPNSTSKKINFQVTPAFYQGDFEVKDDTDSTKRLKFNVTGITTATTRTATWPDKSGTVAFLDDISGGGFGNVLNNGNSFGGVMTLGTNDDYSLQLETNGIARTIIDNTGSLSSTTTTANTSTVNTVMTLESKSSGTPTTGFGTRLQFKGQSSTTVGRDMGYIESAWTDATDGSRATNFVFRSGNTSTGVELARMASNAFSVGASSTLFFNSSGLTSSTSNISLVADGASNNIFINPGTSHTSPTLAKNGLFVGGVYVATSGSGFLNSINIATTYNISGTASGVQMGININPTLTSFDAGTYRAINIIPDRANVFGIYQLGANTLNYFNGKVGLGTSAPSEMLSLGLTGTTLGVMSFAGSTSGKVIIQPAAAAGSWTLTLPTGAGTNGQVLTTNGSGVTSWTTASSGTPAGSNTQIQYNNSGAFGANANFAWDNTNTMLEIGTPTGGTARIVVKGAGTSGSTYAFQSYNSSNTERTRITDHGYFQGIGVGLLNFGMSTYFKALARVQQPFDTSFTDTSGTITLFDQYSTFAPTSGTATNTGIAIAQQINQTGGANGITRGLFIDPSLIAAADFRAIETTSGRVIFGGISGTVIPRLTTTERNALTSPLDGTILYNSTSNKFTVRQNGAWSEMGSGGGITDGDYGDITVSSTGTVWTIDNNAVTNAKINDVAASKLTSGALPASFAFGTTAASTARFNYTGANPAMIVSNTANETSIFSPDGEQYLSTNNVSTLIGSGTTNMEYIDGVLRLWDSDLTQYVGIKPPATGSLTSSYTLTLPVDDGTSGQVLSTDGTGVLSWITAGGGGISDGGNSTGAPITIGTNDANSLTLETNNTARFVIDSSGNMSSISSFAATNTATTRLTIGTNSTGVAAAGLGSAILFQGESTTTDSQDQASITAQWATATHASRTGEIYFKLAQSGNMTNAFRIQGSGNGIQVMDVNGTNPVTLHSAGLTINQAFTFSNNGNNLIIGNSTGVTTLNSTKTSTSGAVVINATVETSSVLLGRSSNVATTGTNREVEFVSTFNPTSGTATYTLLQNISTINQTGGANGIVRFAYDNPTLTAVADYRAFETSVNTANAKGFYQSGTSAFNVLAGKTRFGSTTAATNAISVTGNMNVTGQYVSDRFALTDGATIAVNWNNGNVQAVTLGGNRTFTFSNPISGGRYLIVLKQDGTGSRTVTWPTIKWQGGTAPTLTTTAGKVDLITLIWDGTDYFGVASTNF